MVFSRTIYYPSSKNLISTCGNSPRQSSSLPILNEVVEKLDQIYEAASLINTTKDNQFLDYCIFFDFGFFETLYMIYETQPIYLGFR